MNQRVSTRMEKSQSIWQQWPLCMLVTASFWLSSWRWCQYIQIFCSVQFDQLHLIHMTSKTASGKKSHVKANSQQLVTVHFPLIQRSNHCPCTLVVRSLRPRYEKPPEQKVGRLMLWYDISEWISYQITQSHKSKRKTRCSISFKWQTWHENSKSVEWFSVSSSDETIEGWD